MRRRLAFPRRANLGTWVLRAAAVVVVFALIAAGVVALVTDDDADVIARDARTDRTDGDWFGRARRSRWGVFTRLETNDVDADDGFLEVWLIDSSVERLVSLGPLRSDGRYELPAGLDPGSFPVVDVSAEPVDGNPTHSGDSRLRGTLEF